MEASTVVALVGAGAALVTAIGGLVASLTVFLPILREARAVHTLVNQQHTDMKRYQRLLVMSLRQHGIEVPDDPADEE